MTLRALADDIDDQIDERCDQFETAWRNGSRPTISDFIRAEDEAHRDRLFCELLLVDVEFRRALGEQPSELEYVRQFPSFVAQIHATKLRYGDAVFLTLHADAETIRDIPKSRGSRIAQFELIERLGIGGMGEAWKAWDTVLNRYVTIKLPHYHALNENDRKRFLREARAAAQFTHPQLAGVYEVHNEGDTVYIVATFVEGRNLQEYASRKQMSTGEIVELCAGIGDALQSAHEAGVIHRDLKPANLIIAPNGRPHVIDFGLAKLLDAECDVTLNGELLGTPGYMSPELAEGKSIAADARTDVYSLGIILYELLTGQCPFRGSRRAVISQILVREPSPPRSLSTSIPRDLETICLKAIEKAPENRYQSAREMADDLRRFAAGNPIQARRTGILEKCWRSLYRHSVAAVVWMLVLVAAVAAIATVARLQVRNKQLAGYRPVQITTTPGGARVAIVPLDRDTNEPVSDAAAVIRPPGTTPLTTELKPGAYLIEAVLPGPNRPAFAEVYRTVSDPADIPASTRRQNKELGLEPETRRFSDIKISPIDELDKDMVEVPVPRDALRSNPMLPEKLLVDANQTTAADLIKTPEFASFVSVDSDDNAAISYVAALRWTERNGTRTPTATEMDLIAEAVKNGNAHRVGSGQRAGMQDLFDAFPEWTITTKAKPDIQGNRARWLQSLHVLKGFAGVSDVAVLYPWAGGLLLVDRDTKSPKISIRGVRSAAPRLLKP